MADRRSLSDGLKTAPPAVDPEVAKQFVYGDTRARDHLLVTSVDPASEFLADLQS